MTQNRGKISSTLRAIWAGLTIAIGLAITIPLLTFLKDNGRAARRYFSLFFTLNRFKLERIGEYDLEADLIIMNHQSMTDIICIESDHPRNICWIAKKELGETFFWGRALRDPEMILIDRENKRSIVEIIRQARNRISQGRPIVIFPEGTRNKGEMEFLPFKEGARILAEKLNLKVQPIVIVNSRSVFNLSPLHSYTNVVRMVVMPGFTPSDEDWYKRLRDDMLQIYRKHYKELNSVS